jgi:hypothetical protein
MRTWLRCLMLLAMIATPSQAAVIVIDFSNNAGLGSGSGTTQTITQNGIQMSSLLGLYEITPNPSHELNLKDFDVGERRVQFELVSGLNFDFIGFSRSDGSGNATITSNRGGSITFSNVSAVDFSGPLWDDLEWIQVSASQRFGEFKFNSFTFNDAPTISAAVAEPSTLVLLAGGLIVGCLRRRRA